MSNKARNSFIFKLFALLFLQECVCCINFLLNGGKFSNNSKNERPRSSINASVMFSSTDHPYKLAPSKKWQVGRVSRKQYEIVNMLWRKTKIFVDIDSTSPSESRLRRSSPRTAANRQEKVMSLHTTSKPVVVSSTGSYIEFYYLDDDDDRVKRRDPFLQDFRKTYTKSSEHNKFPRSPVISFHIDDHVHKPKPKVKFSSNEPKLTKEPEKEKPLPENKKPSIYGYLSSRFKVGLVRPNFRLNFDSQITHSTLHFNDETCPVTTESPSSMNVSDSVENYQINSEVTSNVPSVNTTPAYDKIKFFEMYDQYTLRSLNEIEKVMSNKEEFENLLKENEIFANRKISLADVNENIGHHDGENVKFVRKHIDENFNSTPKQMNATIIEKRVQFKSVVFNSNKTGKENIKYINQEKPTKTEFGNFRNATWRVFGNLSREASWSNNPFAAVYIYKPSQIHCDAAALSPHWLVAAGSCLSRFHNKDPAIKGRSAYVAYCGQNWWKPERVSYVKYSIVHPQFHPKDVTRRALFNIGLIQVVGSMSSACFGWAPISLMSHHFAAESDGSLATAVGWGLDRYDVRYSAAELPKEPLSAFDGYVYTDSCPGRNGFGKPKRYAAENWMKNLYCLALPPYTGEQNDPVHGGLLLVGGKLIALYLQEERRSWGDQSAKYTGVWRLVPWVHEVAREQYESDGFALDF